jgi:hypothetical protein
MKDKRPIRMVRKRGYLLPDGLSDLETIEAIKEGEPIEITIKRRRSLPQLQAYWSMLARVVEATDAFPSAERLHEALKMDLGITTPIKTLTGDIFLIPDSVAFNKMTAPEFRAYFQAAEKRIAETFGIDPAELREAA